MLACVLIPHIISSITCGDVKTLYTSSDCCSSEGNTPAACANALPDCGDDELLVWNNEANSWLCTGAQQFRPPACAENFTSYVDGRLCMSSIMEGANMWTATRTCQLTGPGSRVCTWHDYTQACPSGDIGNDTGWLGNMGRIWNMYLIPLFGYCPHYSFPDAEAKILALDEKDINEEHRYRCCY